MANPMVGCRVQKTCWKVSGANRRSREERQGRNTYQSWHADIEGMRILWKTRIREWTLTFMPMEGRSLETSRKESGDYRVS